MSKTEFTPEDFNNSLMFHETPEQLAAQANKLLPEIKEAWKAEMLKDAVVVYGNPDRGVSWMPKALPVDTHKALLIQVEPIVKAECKHIPRFTSNAVENICKRCGVELFATWSTKS